MKTIARNATRKIAALQETHTSCKVYSLNNFFHGVECTPEAAWADLARFDFSRARLADDGHVVIHVHDNLWFELRRP